MCDTPPPIHGLLTKADLVTVPMWTYLLPVAVGLWFYDRIDRAQRTILLLPLASFCMEVVNGSRTMKELVANPCPTNYPFFHVWAPVLFLLLSLVYRDYLPRRWVVGLNAAFLVVAIVAAVWIDGLYRINATTLPLLSVGAIVFVCTYLYRLMATLEVRRLDGDPLFWASVGLLFYYAGSFLVFLSLRYLVSTGSYDSLHSVYRIHTGLVLVLNTLLTLALWMKPLPPSTRPPSWSAG